MKVLIQKPLMRMISMPGTILCFLLLLATSAFAQDPPQYGTPFAGVPDPRDVNMYQAHLRIFSPGSNFASVTARLDQIQALGINVLYLMPIFPHGTDAQSTPSPYCIKDFKAVASEYGDLNSLRTLVDGAHARGMAVILDIAINGTSWDHAWRTSHPEYYTGSQLGPFPDIAGLNLNHAGTRAALIDAMRYWIFAANVDGYRCDFANNPPLDFWTQVINNLRGISSHKILMMAEGDRLENFQAGFDLNFGDKWFYDALEDVSKLNASVNSRFNDVNNVEYTYANSTQQVVRYTGNHDTYTNGFNGVDGGARPFLMFNNHNGIVANFLVSAFMRGVPFLMSGQEVDYNLWTPWPWTASNLDINWSQNPSASADFSRILNLRKNSTAIRRGALATYSNNDVCAFTKISGSEKVVVIANMRNANVNFTIPAGLAGTYANPFNNNASVTLTSGANQALGAYGYLVLTSGSSCAPTAITPYMAVNGGAWTQTSSATLTAGGSVAFGPQPASGGSWSWTGPNGFTSTSREFTLSNVQTSQGGTYTATHTNASGCASTQNFSLTVNPPPSNLPSPWQTQDIGAVGAAGSANHSSGTFTVTASGADVFDFADEFRFVYQPFSGNVTVTARVASLTNTNAWAKAGVMIRETLNANSSHAAMLLTPSNGFNFQYRNGTGAGSTAAGNAGGAIPNWVRITRSGNTLTGYSSTNGTSWTQAGTVTITMASSVSVGFFATSHADGTLTTATFTNVTVSGGGNNLTVSPTSLSFGSGASNGTINVTSNVAWTVTDNQTWITTSATSGSNNGSFTVSATANTGAARSGTVTVTGGGITQTINVSQSAVATTTYYSIRNRWTGAYLFDNGNNVGYGSSVANNSYKWEKVTIDATYFWLRNLGTGHYAHIENQTGAVQCTTVDIGWWSSQWSQESVDATYVRIRNRWQSGSIIHIENQNGSAQYSGGQDGWYSAHWQLTSVAAREATDEVAEVESNLVNVFPNPSSANEINISISALKEGEVADLAIQDVNGKTALQTVVGKQATIRHNLNPGLYLLRLRSHNINATKKVMIEK